MKILKEQIGALNKVINEERESILIDHSKALGQLFNEKSKSSMRKWTPSTKN